MIANNPKTPQYLTMEEQQLYLESALNVVKLQAFQMKLCLDKGKLMDVLKHASAMITELRTTVLSPKNYYELYMKVTDELQHLQMFLVDELRKETKDNNLYELVQYAANIVPRLYLLVTVGSAYIKNNLSLRRTILKDLVEMCRGVQHPLKGLFLRSYLLQCARNILPDSLVAENDDGTVKDSIDFVLVNFGEMNKLWVRMQHQGHSRDKERLENERKELRILVGTNLVRLSQLESVTIEHYSKIILPGILEQVVSCHDAIAQEYLMECIIQVFPDEFHLCTLDVFLKTCAELNQGVNIKNIIISLMNRLAAYNQRMRNINKSEVTENSDSFEIDKVELFEVFSEQISYIVQTRNMSTDEIIALKVALINLAQKSYPDRVDYIDKVMCGTINVLDQLNIEELEYNKPISKELTRLMKLPIDHYNNILKIVELQYFNKLLKYFDLIGQKNLALYLIMNVLDHQTIISNHEQVEKILDMLSSIIDRKTENESDNDYDLEELVDEQLLLARLLHHFKSTDLDEQFIILKNARKFLSINNMNCIRYTLPPLVFQAYQLAFQYKETANENDLWKEKCQEIFQFCHSIIVSLMKSDLDETPLRLFLQGALAISKIKFDDYETIAYEFISQAFSIYEDEISESKAQLAAISLIIATLEHLDCFSEENAEPLRTQCALAGSKLLKKPDQCRAAIICSHLFWSGKNSGSEIRDEKRVTERLLKSFNIAKQCLNNLVQVQLFIEILNHYIFFYERGCAKITIDMINELIFKLKNATLNLDNSEETDQIVKYFANTLAYLRSKLEMFKDDNLLYKDLVL